MSFIIYNIETTRYLDGKDKLHNTESAAKRYLTLAVKNGAGILKRDEYAIADAIDFHNDIEKLVTRTNLMSQLKYQERVNTPISCSPASETYWSM